jgi:hypothetical protein
MRQVLIVIVVFILCANRIIAQAIDLGTWNIVNVKYNYNKEWSVFVEGQLRSLKFYSNFHYYEYKGGISYSGLKNVKLTLGSGSYQTYKEGGNFVLPKNNDEFRIWPQISLLQSLGKFNIEQRYRAEFRFTSDGYRNRFRYRLGVSYPLGKQKNGFNPFQISVSDEIFFTNKEPYFERNRMLFAFNYKPSKSSTLQIGYIHQFDYKINDETGRDFFQIGYFIELSRKSTSNSAIENYSKDN